MLATNRYLDLIGMSFLCVVAVSFELFESLGGRRDLGDEIADQGLVRQRRKRHLARLEPRGASVDGFAVELDHAFLASIGVDAGKPHRQRGILVDAQPAQPVEHRLPWLERHFEGLPPRWFAMGAAADFQCGEGAHDDSASAGAPESCSTPPASRTR